MMKRLGITLVLVFSFVSLTPAVNAEVGEGLLKSLLPFREPDIEALYAHVAVEHFIGNIAPSEMELFIKKSESPDEPPVYKYRRTIDGRDVDSNVQIWSNNPVPPARLFFANYDIRINGLDEVGGRSCFNTTVVSKSTGLPGMQTCVDSETGVALRTITFNIAGQKMSQTTYKKFDPNPDLSNVYLGRETVDWVHKRDMTSEEFVALLPWLQPPTWLPPGFELLAIQRIEDDDAAHGWGGDVHLTISDGFRTILVTVLWFQSTGSQPPTREFAEHRSPVPYDETLQRIALLTADPFHRIMAYGEKDDEDLFRILWSMVADRE